MARDQRFRFRFRLDSGAQPLCLGAYALEDAELGARLYDCLQLLLNGPRAATNFEWRAYARADVEAAAALLRDKGEDVQAAVVAAREWRTKAVGVYRCNTRWAASVFATTMPGDAQRTSVTWCGLPNPRAAARQADCGLLAVQGLGCLLNHPASGYGQRELEAAGEYAARKGVQAERVKQNLEAVAKARQEGTLDAQVASLQARQELLDSLGIIPPEYTFESALAAAPPPPDPSKEDLFDATAPRHKRKHATDLPPGYPPGEWDLHHRRELRRKVELSPGQQEQWQQELLRLEQQWQEPSLMEAEPPPPASPAPEDPSSSVPAEPPAAGQPQLAQVWGQLEAARKEMANLQASLSAALKQRNEACRHLIAERVEMAAEKEQGARLVEELTEELKVKKQRTREAEAARATAVQLAEELCSQRSEQRGGASAAASTGLASADPELQSLAPAGKRTPRRAPDRKSSEVPAPSALPPEGGSGKGRARAGSLREGNGRARAAGQQPSKKGAASAPPQGLGAGGKAAAPLGDAAAALALLGLAASGGAG